ncbi:MAG: hypothetical protein U0Y10_13650 [Spirosomataceae bacterium]
MKERRRTQTLLIVCILFMFLFNYPVLSIFNTPSFMGLPSLYVYVFAIWLLLIWVVYRIQQNT